MACFANPFPRVVGYGYATATLRLRLRYGILAVAEKVFNAVNSGECCCACIGACKSVAAEWMLYRLLHCTHRLVQPRMKRRRVGFAGS